MSAYFVNTQRPVRRGFTLVELLVVIAIIVTLAGLIVAGVGLALRKGRETEAKTMCVQIVSGVDNFYADHNRLPIQGAAGADVQGNTEDSVGVLMLTALTNREQGGGQAGGGGNAGRLNTKGIDYFNWKIVQGPNGGLFFNGNQLQGLYDPFGQPLQFVIDGDYNNRILDPTGNGPEIAGRIIVWSFGRDGQGSPQIDWIYSWK